MSSLVHIDDSLREERGGGVGQVRNDRLIIIIVINIITIDHHNQGVGQIFDAQLVIISLFTSILPSISNHYNQT